MRIATGAISHETSTFTPVETTWVSYRDERFGYLHGTEIIDKFRGSNTPMGGFIEGAEAHGFELLPTVFAEPHPSGPTPRVIFDEILGELLDGIRAAGPVDGVLLELHGSMVAEGVDDGEGFILDKIRELVGPGVPLVAQLDIHSSISPLMVEKADVLIGRETFPEVDMATRGRECADVLVDIIGGRVRPEMALHTLPMIWGMNQVTAHPPMRQAIEELHRLEAVPGVVCASIATGFPLVDVPAMGSSVYVVTDNDPDLAQRLADELGAWIWARKEQWQAPLPPSAKILQKAQNGPLPLVLADRNDNTGGGSPGDSTGMLRAFIDAGLDKACILYIVDPEAVDACHHAGAGTRLRLDVGGKSSPLQGPPCPMDAEVMALSDGRFRYDGPMYAGLETSMGPSAHIRQNGLHVILTCGREQPFDTAFARSLGLNPKEMDYIGVKSAAHFRAGFESWAGAVYVVGEPGVHDPLSGHLQFKNLGRKVYPIDMD